MSPGLSPFSTRARQVEQTPARQENGSSMPASAAASSTDCVSRAAISNVRRRPSMSTVTRVAFAAAMAAVAGSGELALAGAGVGAGAPFAGTGATFAGASGPPSFTQTTA